MNEITWERIKSIFHEASELPMEERQSFLDRACADDTRLRAEVEELLESHQEVGDDESEAMTEGVSAGTPSEGVGDVIGRYKVLQVIGEGGFGTVYMAEQEEPVRRRVALKIIKLGMDTKEVIARFEAERQALALMDHPNIAKVFDAGATESGRPFFVMELVRGIPITEYCDQNKLGTNQRLELFMAVCGAVQHAHQKGIIHRDIKPSNVMVTLHDGTPVPKIIDFGIAKATNQRLTEKTLFTQFNQFIGTPAYMSPEQAEMSGLDVDTRSDIYSLGVLLYELLTGTTPLDTRQLGKVAYSEIQRLIRDDEPHRPSVRISTLGQAATSVAEHQRTDLPGLAKALRGDLDWVVMKALEKDRTRRYETANALRMELRRYLDDEPVLASPPGTIYRLRKFVRRNRTGVSVVATVATALVIGILLASVGFLQARKEAAAAKAINDFFNGMLASVDPLQLHQHSGFAREGGVIFETTGAYDRNISVLELMLRARDHIGPSFAGKPALEATARETIGLSLIGLGRTRDAADELRTAAEIRRTEFGPTHPDTLRSELQLGLGLTESGQAPEAVSLLTELRQRMTEEYGENDPRTLQASSLYATSLMMDRRHSESDPIFKDTLEWQRQVLGEGHRDTIDTMNQWANSFMWRNRGADAEALTRPAYESALRLFGPDDVLTLIGQTRLGWSRNFQGNRVEGYKLLRPAADGLERALGNDHPDTSRAKSGLARSVQYKGGGTERIRLWTEALEGLRAAEGIASPAIYVTSRDLADALLDFGNEEESLRLYRRAVDDFRATYGETHEWTTDNIGYLVRALWRVGRLDEAREMTADLFETWHQMAEDPQATAATLGWTAWELLNWRPEELRDPRTALPFAERAVAQTSDIERADHLETYAHALHENRRHREAIETQLEALSLQNDEAPVQLSYDVARLVIYMDAEGGAEGAIHDRVVEHVWRLQESSPSAIEFARRIGGFSNRMAEGKLHHYSELARREGLTVVEQHWDADPMAMAALHYRIGRALLHQGKALEAEESLRAGIGSARDADDFDVLISNQINLAESLAHQRKLDEVGVIASDVRDKFDNRPDQEVGLDWYETGLKAEAGRLLGLVALRSGDVASAKTQLGEAVRWFKQTHWPNSWRRARAMSAWGECLVALGRFDEAEQILLNAHEVLVEEVGEQSTATMDTALRIEHLYKAWGKPTKAEIYNSVTVD